MKVDITLKSQPSNDVGKVSVRNLSSSIIFDAQPSGDS